MRKVAAPDRERFVVCVAAGEKQRQRVKGVRVLRGCRHRPRATLERALQIVLTFVQPPRGQSSLAELRIATHGLFVRLERLTPPADRFQDVTEPKRQGSVSAVRLDQSRGPGVTTSLARGL
jgi:hypothetical protein